MERILIKHRLVRYWLLLGTALLLTGCGGGADSPNNTSPPGTADTARFLEQSSWGPSEATIADVQQKGFENYLVEQFSAPASSLGTYPAVDSDSTINCPNNAPNHTVCFRDNYTPFPLQARSFRNALNGQDQLRQRVAFALSQILVVSARDGAVAEAYAIAPYQEILAKQAFGNFRDILAAITLSPAMGKYLNMVNNTKPDPARGIAANENYARELLQLFSIGVYELNNDGTLKHDQFGRPVPAYDQDTIEDLANALTGWTYPTRPGHSPQSLNPPYFIGPMVAVANNHDTSQKKLLDGVVLPANQTPQKDLDDAINNIFNHPNVGPFIGKQLIQQLVTSNPSAGYVSRVASVFNNNGQGVRGDMKAVIKAILLDDEARGDEKTDPDYGKLREPMKFIAGLLRALGGRSDGVFPISQSAAMGQDIYKAPSVFNFYPASYPLPETNLVSPVSAIFTAGTVHVRANFVNTLLYSSNGIAPDATVTGATGTQIDLSPFVALADDPDKLMDKLDLVLMHQRMSADMRRIIIGAVNAIPVSDRLARARAAIYLVATSPQYQVER